MMNKRVLRPMAIKLWYLTLIYGLRGGSQTHHEEGGFHSLTRAWACGEPACSKISDTQATKPGNHTKGVDKNSK